MTKPLFGMTPRHATDLNQGWLFIDSLDEFEASTRVSVDELKRWQERGLISFDPERMARFDERHRIEVEFVSTLVRSGLSDDWIDRVLSRLPKPYCYDPSETFYSIAHGEWVTPWVLRTDDAIEEYLLKLKYAEDWDCLRDLRERIDGILPEDEDDEQR